MSRPASAKFFRVFKLSKPNGKRHWKVEGRPTGKRERYYCVTEREANQTAIDLNSQIAAFGTQNALTDTERVMAGECIRLLASYGKNLYEAAHFFRDHLDRLATSVSAAALCERVGAEFERRLTSGEISGRHAESMRETLRKFERRFGTESVALLTAHEIKTWLAGLDLAVKTRNRHLGYVQNILNMAKSWGLLSTNPLDEVTPFNDPARNGRQVSVLSPEQLQKFLAALRPEFLPFFAVSAFTGLRRAEVERLDWSEVKLDRKLIDLPFAKSKNGKRKLIEIPENLVKILTPYVVGIPTNSDVALIRATSVLPPSPGLQIVMTEAAAKAGISPWPQNVLRHSFCSYAVALKGLTWTAGQADHSERMLREHYWEVVEKAEAERYFAIRSGLNAAPPFLVHVIDA
jgi:integrase